MAALEFRPRQRPAEHPRRGGRVVECARLEIWFTVKRNVGSNPTLSARPRPSHCQTDKPVKPLPRQYPSTKTEEVGSWRRLKHFSIALAGYARELGRPRVVLDSLALEAHTRATPVYLSIKELNS